LAPSVFVTEAIEAVPFPSAPNVVASYPHRKDWWNRYPALRRADSRKRTIDEFEWLYQEQKNRYQAGVLKRLDKLQRSDTGRAVFAEMRARSSYSVYILPWEFAPTIDNDPSNLGVTEKPSMPQTPRERARGIKPPGTDVRDMRGWYSASMDKPGSVDVFYTDYRCEEDEANGVLLHEIVHALRMIWGTSHEVKMRGGYPNSEEFYANIIEMIYQSERGFKVFDYRFHPIDQASVLRHPMQRALLAELRNKHPLLFVALAKVKAPFNPIRPIAEKLLTIDL
jgi:hypothetical protein